MPRFPRSFLVFALLTGSSLVLACGEDSLDPDGSGAVAAVLLSPTKGTILVGQSLSLDVTLLDSDGERLAGQSVTWSSSAPAVATVAGGLVTGIHRGEAVITAAADGRSATARVTVRFPVDEIRITPESPTIATGTSVQLEATVLNAEGEVIEDRIVEWQTLAPRIALVSVGKVRGLRVGTAEIVAIVGDRSARTTVTVLPNIGGLWSLTATLEDTARGLACTVAGPLTLMQNGAGVAGVQETAGTCVGAGDPITFQGGSEIVDASLSALVLDVLLRGPVSCTYNGELTGTPVSGGAGFARCSGELAGAPVTLTGQWEMHR